MLSFKYIISIKTINRYFDFLYDVLRFWCTLYLQQISVWDRSYFTCHTWLVADVGDNANVWFYFIFLYLGKEC